jgi:hypothetical protein
MSSISIGNLSQQQTLIADILWQCQNRDQVDSFISGLPTVDLQNQAKTLVDLIIYESVDQCYNNSDEFTEADELITRIKRL